MKRFLLSSLLFAAITAENHAAQVVFTVTGSVVSSDVAGYAADDVITITYVANGGTSTFSASDSAYEWYEETLGEDVVFSTVEISGATGAWSRPSSSDEAPESLLYVIAGQTPDIGWVAAADTAEDPDARTGLFIAGQPVTVITSQGRIDLPFEFPGNDATIESYFSSFQGTYALIPYSGGMESYIDLLDGSTIRFNATSVTISIVPEPSGMLLGAGGILLIGFRRRRLC